MNYCSLFVRQYEQTSSCVQVNGKNSQSFCIGTGVRQGCAVPPELFDCAIDYVIVRTNTRVNFSLKFVDRLLSDVDFAEDLALMTNTLDGLCAALRVKQRLC